MTIYYVGAFVGSSRSIWFSSGRHRKIEQVSTLLQNLGYQIVRLNTAPDSTIAFSHSTISLCQTTFTPLRYFQILINSLRYFSSLPKSTDSRLIIWTYNTRFSESLVALTACFIFPSLELILQLEDLPFARKENHYVAGFLDYISTYLLTRRANYIFAVSDSVSKAFVRLFPFYSPTVPHSLPPFLDSAYLDLISTRHEPFRHDTINVLYAGSYLSEKGVDDLLTAFLLLPPSIFNLCLIGPAPDSYVSRFSRLKNVFFTGMVSNDDLYLRYSQSDIIVNPHRPISNSSYVFPHKLVEIVASGSLPLITSSPGAESFNLPELCFFKTVDELAHKLLVSRQIWHQCRTHVLNAAQYTRNIYSYCSVFEHMRSILGCSTPNILD